jgi:hypothetical protein
VAENGGVQSSDKASPGAKVINDDAPSSGFKVNMIGPTFSALPRGVSPDILRAILSLTDDISAISTQAITHSVGGVTAG